MLGKRLVWACALWIACAAGDTPWQTWQSPHARDHAMTGRIIDVRARRPISPEILLERLSPARFVLLGEKHDNPDHHRLQAWVIEGLARAGAPRAVLFEMLPLDVAAALAEHGEAHPDDVDGIAGAVGWSELGWPPWELYRPVFAAARGAEFPVLPAGLPTDELTRLRSGAPPPQSLVALGVAQPLAPAALEQLRDDLVRAHCGALPAGALDRLVAIQRARDAQLAAALAAGARAGGAVLIAGAGHVGHRWGVPTYLARAAPGAVTVAVALLEVDPGAPDLESLLSPPPPFDYLWMTPRVENVDPCERFRDSLRRLQSRPAVPRRGGILGDLSSVSISPAPARW